MNNPLLDTIQKSLPSEPSLSITPTQNGFSIKKQLSSPSALQLMLFGGEIRSYTLDVVLDEAKKTATIIEKENQVFSNGMFSFGFKVEKTKNGVVQNEQAAQYGINSQGGLGKSYAVSFDASAYKNPVISSLQQNGWQVITSILQN